MSNTRTHPFRAQVKSCTYKAAGGLSERDERIGKEAKTNTVLIYCVDVGFAREHRIPRRDSRDGMWTA